jgi:hypothetical protein
MRQKSVPVNEPATQVLKNVRRAAAVPLSQASVDTAAPAPVGDGGRFLYVPPLSAR